MKTTREEIRSLETDIEHGSEQLHFDQEALGEFESQYFGERSRYGDSWPGSDDERSELINGLERTSQAHQANLDWEKKMYGVEL